MLFSAGRRDQVLSKTNPSIYKKISLNAENILCGLRRREKETDAYFSDSS